MNGRGDGSPGFKAEETEGGEHTTGTRKRIRKNYNIAFQILTEMGRESD